MHSNLIGEICEICGQHHKTASSNSNLPMPANDQDRVAIRAFARRGSSARRKRICRVPVSADDTLSGKLPNEESNALDHQTYVPVVVFAPFSVSRFVPK